MTKYSFMICNQGEIADWCVRSNITFMFDAFERHLDFANQSIIQEKENIEADARRYVETLNLNDDEDAQRAYDECLHYDNEHFQALNLFPQILCRSEFLAIYSFFEHTLNQLCSIVKEKSALNLSLKDLNGKGISRARTYLIKVAGVDGSCFDQQYWPRIILAGEIRNAIAHKNGKIDTTSQDEGSIFPKIIQQGWIERSLIQLNKDNSEILLSDAFIKQSISDFRKVIMDICSFKLYPNEVSSK